MTAPRLSDLAERDALQTGAVLAIALADCRAFYPETFRTTTAELGPRPEDVPDV